MNIFNKIEIALKVALPFVAYRHPKSDEIKGFFQKNDEIYHAETYKESGFVFAPFDDTKHPILFPLDKSKIIISHFSDENASNESKEDVSIFISEEEKINHIDLVQRGIDFLKTTKNKKVVLSRKLEVDKDVFELLKVFKKLLLTYKNAMVYVWFHPKVGLWLGATPETLLKVKENKFSTMALAGTQAYKGSLVVDWQTKELQEQQFVTDYIVEKLKGKLTVSDVKTIKAGSLVHLCTSISGSLSQQFLLKGLITLLHPTPAVCGFPQQEAKTFILNNEYYNREFYTGFFGEINMVATSSLFVNLRCMQVLKKSIVIYIGGGITKDSNPEKEWEETVAKSKTMLKML
ncbi:MAG TPA: isochorismate synthase [Flavobacteriaceae bacterium]|nr:isochorismate synthase [Flavobacteriaceae bacterium]